MLADNHVALHVDLEKKNQILDQILMPNCMREVKVSRLSWVGRRMGGMEKFGSEYAAPTTSTVREYRLHRSCQRVLG